VGGSFTTAAGQPASYVANLNGNIWTNLGSGVNNTVETLAMSGSDLYAGGFFTVAGNHGANGIAKWDGGEWASLGSGVNGSLAPAVHAIAVSATNELYAAGSFTTAGGIPATNIARWTGTNWTNLSLGLGQSFESVPTVYALALSGSNLYAGGGFVLTGDSIGVNHIAKWDGTSWSALGQGTDDYIYALAVSGHDLYVGGDFTMAGGLPANRIAKWNGQSWTALGNGMNDAVLSLAAVNGNVYAGGYFTVAGSAPANHIARWDGTNWTAMGSGINDVVYELAGSGNDLYAGGEFTIAGGKVSAYLARAYLLPLPLLSINRSFDGLTVSWPSPDGPGFLLEQSDGMAPPFVWEPNSDAISDDDTNKFVIVTPTNSTRFFRLRRP
jgi:hypothetical protein